MARQMAAEGLAWPRFSIQERVDLIVYVENLPDRRLGAPTLRLGDPTSGAQIFDTKNCSYCHSFGGDDPAKVNLLETTEQEHRLTGLAVEMWNHRPLMEAAARNCSVELATFESVEMSDLVAFLVRARLLRGARGSSTRRTVVPPEEVRIMPRKARLRGPNLRARDEEPTSQPPFGVTAQPCSIKCSRGALRLAVAN